MSQQSTNTKYYQLRDCDLPKIVIDDKILLVNDRDFYTDEILLCAKTKIAAYWMPLRMYLLVILTIIPFLLFPIDVLKKSWITSLLGLIACCLPSGGAPIAVGLLFMPCLQMIGLTPKKAVAFCSATQSFGCGVFTPLNWYSKDQGIFIKSTLPLCLVSGILGLWLALFHFPLAEHQVGIFFACFCVFLAGTVMYGIFHDLTTQNESVKFEKITTLNGFKTYAIYIIASIIGGMVSGWIGIGIEKIYFLLVTSYHKAEIRRATITAIALIGWISTISASIHFFILKDVPIAYWVCSLPGILLGSIAGPIINSYLGSFNIMIIFCTFLFLNVIFEITK